MCAARFVVYFRIVRHDFGPRPSSPSARRLGTHSHRSPAEHLPKINTALKRFLCQMNRICYQVIGGDWFTFRSTLTRYGSLSESSMRSGSIVYRKRFIRTIARTHSMAYWNFLRALNWLCRRSCNFKRGKRYILSLVSVLR